ncbi:uncharacterized protein LOC113228302 [Hyposmocoma kahamanoa]|uniref:uncharacterized protein LOC113228302 n=1 Tax=Hyposmocoma kahamanoa TaxID=1477025 RepID=UPI000E6D6C66|nr:uncharacterized protein LOC113228302 [Hyposmocoma kahamanoa]
MTYGAETWTLTQEAVYWMRVAQRAMKRVMLGLKPNLQEKLEEPRTGHWTIRVIRPVLAEWADRSWVGISYHLAQVLTGHGCFGKYLCMVGRERTTVCQQCGCAEDTAQHTLLAFDEHDLSLPTVVRGMVGSERAWSAVASFCTDVLSRKEAAEREEDPSSYPMRRKRLGRRRLANCRPDSEAWVAKRGLCHSLDKGSRVGWHAKYSRHATNDGVGTVKSPRGGSAVANTRRRGRGS